MQLNIFMPLNVMNMLFFPVPRPAEVAQAAWLHPGLSVALLSFSFLLLLFLPLSSFTPGGQMNSKWHSKTPLKPAKQRALKRLWQSQILCTVKGLKAFVKQKRHTVHAPVPTFQKVMTIWCLGLRQFKDNTLEWGKRTRKGKGSFK